MAKRKRLTPSPTPFVETTGAEAPPEGFPPGPRHAPIADVAREAAAAAALDEVTETLSRARDEGRMVLSLPLDAIVLDHLVRDRIAMAEPEIDSLMQSLKSRGQQAPIEVMDLGNGRYGLISGWRRCQALARLVRETGEARFATVLALLRRPDQAPDAYLAMVEENEIRVGLSFYERARIVVKAVEQGVFETEKKALQTLFANTSRAKRSKVGSFIRIVHALDGLLRFPEALSERAGLALAKALTEEPALSERLQREFQQSPARDVNDEQTRIERFVGGNGGVGSDKRKTESENFVAALPEDGPGEPAPPSDILLRRNGKGDLILSGTGVTPKFYAALRQWLLARDTGQ